MRQGLVAAILVGALLGVLGARVLFVDSALSLVPWSVAGLVLGAVFADSRRQTRGVGAAYGFALAYSFMIASYDGASAVAGKLLPFLPFGVFGAICGTLLAIVGASIGARVRGR